MGRVIKFRLWHDDTMYDVYEIQWSAGGIKEIHAENAQAGYRYHAADLKRCVLMQFTGLSDRNGKEIYEGDIVQSVVTIGHMRGPEREEVMWDEEACGFSPFCVYDVMVEGYLHAAQCEVVGNIYEHPDLLTEKLGAFFTEI